MERINNYLQELNTVPHWYALHTKPRHEKKVVERLCGKCVENYLPLNTVFRRWSDRYKKVTEPLFSCYVFVKITLKEQLKPLQTDGVMNLVSFNGHPSPIPESQIYTLKLVLDEMQFVNNASYFSIGERVRVIRGVLQGVEGVLIQRKNSSSLVISIDGIKQAISVEISPNDLEKIVN